MLALGAAAEDIPPRLNDRSVSLQDSEEDVNNVPTRSASETKKESRILNLEMSFEMLIIIICQSVCIVHRTHRSEYRFLIFATVR